MLKKYSRNNLSAFGIIEVLIAILIFSLGLSSVYIVIVSTLKTNDYNKNYIIASNLAREQIDLIRNMRDSNYKEVYKWNYIQNPLNDFTKVFSSGYYKIENDFSSSAYFPIKINPILDFGEGISEIKGKIEDYRLYLDSDNNYTYDDDSGANKETKFFKFLQIQPLIFNDGTNDIIIEDAFKITSKVIWTIRGYNELEINTVIADWKRL